MKIAISQPTYLPWLGYFDLIDQVDLFVLLDDVQFSRRSWQQRNRIKTPTGLQWLTVPVVVGGRNNQLIKDVEIREIDFLYDQRRAIELNYRRAPFFDAYFERVIARLEYSPGSKLVDLNVRVIELFMEILGIKTVLLRSSELRQPGTRTQLLANICKSVAATHYISPLGSSVYLLGEQHILLDSGIAVAFQHYEHPRYRQLFPPFLPYASALDILFNEGEGSLGIIRSGRREAFLPVEVAAGAHQHTEAG